MDIELLYWPFQISVCAFILHSLWWSCPRDNFDDCLQRTLYLKQIGVIGYGQEDDINNVINNFSWIYIKNILKQLLFKKEMYKGPINDQTELDCGICLTEMNSTEQEISQCHICKKCVHNDCTLKWEKNNCVYCRQY